MQHALDRERDETEDSNMTWGGVEWGREVLYSRSSNFGISRGLQYPVQPHIFYFSSLERAWT